MGGCGGRWIFRISRSRTRSHWLIVLTSTPLHVFLILSILFKRWQNLLPSSRDFNGSGAMVVTRPVQKGHTSITQVWISKSEHLKSSSSSLFYRSERKENVFYLQSWKIRDIKAWIFLNFTFEKFVKSQLTFSWK